MLFNTSQVKFCNVNFLLDKVPDKEISQDLFNKNSNLDTSDNCDARDKWDHANFQRQQSIHLNWEETQTFDFNDITEQGVQFDFFRINRINLFPKYYIVSLDIDQNSNNNEKQKHEKGDESNIQSSFDYFSLPPAQIPRSFIKPKSARCSPELFNSPQILDKTVTENKVSITKDLSI